jgi:hypothetical protein
MPWPLPRHRFEHEPLSVPAPTLSIGVQILQADDILDFQKCDGSTAAVASEQFSNLGTKLLRQIEH